MTDLKWYAVQVVTSKEMFVASILGEKGYEHFVPALPAHSRPPDRRDRHRALFPGYVFCRINTNLRQPLIVQTPGVIRLVGFGLSPAPIPDEEMSSLKRVSESPLPIETCTAPNSGVRVQITAGPLKGAIGFMQSVRGRHRFVVQISLLNRAVTVEVSADSVHPIEADPFAASATYRSY